MGLASVDDERREVASRTLYHASNFDMFSPVLCLIENNFVILNSFVKWDVLYFTNDHFLMRASEAAKIPIESYLLAEGYKHSRVALGCTELWYHSPIRSGDQTPSFKVNRPKNIWYDHGLDEGGDVIALVCTLRKVTVSEALSIIESLERQGLAQIKNDRNDEIYSTTSIPATQVVVPETKIIKVQEIKHPALMDYLQQWCIDRALAKKHLKEAHYQRATSSQSYFTLGWANGQGFDTRNAYFKGFVGTGKSISTLNMEGNESVLIFEGFLDFLSYVSYCGELSQNEGVLILHSTALKRQAVKAIKQYDIKKVKLFLDRDEVGRACGVFFMKSLFGLSLIDCSDLYAGYKDVNEWYVAFKKEHLS